VAWCDRNGVRLDDRTTLRDLGRSAYTGEHRKNPDRHALAAFLKLVEAGKIPTGSYLVIENLDRLTREDERTALRLWLDILDAGVSIVQLSPETIFRHDRTDMFDVMRAIMELSRGHSESAMKSRRVGDAWQAKLARARGGEGEILTGQLPAWVRRSGDRLVLIPERAAAVRRVFTLSASGYGLAAIVRRLTEENVSAFGPSGKWVRIYVGRILKDRRALGEHQPRTQGGKPDGDPIADYFPAAVTEQEFLAARAGAAERKGRGGREPDPEKGGRVNLFAGMIRDARDGGTFFTATARGGSANRVLINTAGAEGRAKYVSFPAEVFEAAVLAKLAEIDPHDILNGDHAPDEAAVLAGELVGLESKIAELEAELREGDVAALARVLRRLEAEKKELGERLAEARRKAAHPLSESWGESRSLLAVLGQAADPQDARRRLRSALRRILGSIWMLVVPLGRARACAVQLWFANCERHRDYLVLHDPATKRRPGRWWCRSFADATVPGELDLRRRDHARKLERALLALDLSALAP
jgi:DNA invertase Pin-like site-specific DNA recombinase